MCSGDDFVDWQDIDLDELLGEYTDDDLYSPESSVSTGDECVSSKHQ
jgi:hypothetical protein